MIGKWRSDDGEAEFCSVRKKMGSEIPGTRSSDRQAHERIERVNVVLSWLYLSLYSSTGQK